MVVRAWGCCIVAFISVDPWIPSFLLLPSFFLQLPIERNLILYCESRVYYCIPSFGFPHRHLLFPKKIFSFLSLSWLFLRLIAPLCKSSLRLWLIQNHLLISLLIFEWKEDRRGREVFGVFEGKLFQIKKKKKKVRRKWSWRNSKKEWGGEKGERQEGGGRIEKKPLK